MPETYKLTPFRRLINLLMKLGLRMGLAPANTRLLTVQGRTTGKLYETPVNLVQMEGRTYLVSPYGNRSWVRNAVAAGKVTLSRGRKREERSIERVDASTAGKVLKQYVRENAITRPYFASKPEDPAELFAVEADSHPVFRLR